MTEYTSIFDYFNILWFEILPYIAIFTFFLITIQRYTKKGFTYSSLSSQFLENDVHFWGMVPFHYGILFVLLGHIIGFLFPEKLLLWNSHPLRLYILEISAFVGGAFAFIGLLIIIFRRLTDVRAKVVTSTVDWIVLVFLLFLISTGLLTAIFERWGSSWFAASLAPYLWSLVSLNPELAYVTPMPLLVKLHIISAYLIILLFPFTRLVHILVVPNPYLWRKPQLVRWYWDRKRIRKPEFTAGK